MQPAFSYRVKITHNFGFLAAISPTFSDNVGSSEYAARQTGPGESRDRSVTEARSNNQGREANDE